MSSTVVDAASAPAASPHLYLAATGPSEVEGGFQVHPLGGGVAFVTNGITLAEARGSVLKLAFDDLRGAPIEEYLLDPRMVLGHWPDAAYLVAVQRDVTDGAGFGVRPYRWTGAAWTALRPLKHYDGVSLLGPVWSGGQPLALFSPWAIPRPAATWTTLGEGGVLPPLPLPMDECPAALSSNEAGELTAVERSCALSGENGVWIRKLPAGAREAVPGLEGCVPQSGDALLAARGGVVALLARCQRIPTLAMFDGHAWTRAALPAQPQPLDPTLPPSVALTSGGVWVVAGGEVRFGSDAEHLAVVPLPNSADAAAPWLAVRAWQGAEDDVWIVDEDGTGGNVRPQALLRSTAVDPPLAFSGDSQALEEYLEPTISMADCGFPLIDLGAYAPARAATARSALASLAGFRSGASRLLRYTWRGEDRLGVSPGDRDDPRAIERAVRPLGPTRVCRHPAHPEVLSVP